MSESKHVDHDVAAAGGDGFEDKAEGAVTNGSGDRKVALITGITGQDGSYLAELLLGKGYDVHGIIRRASTFNTSRIEHLYADPRNHTGGKMKLHYGDMTDSSSLIKIIAAVKPSEIYNLAAQSHVKVSFDLSEYTAEVDAVGTLRLLDAIRICQLDNKVRFYQASTSELYGKVVETPQNEKTPFYPRSPYGKRFFLFSFCIPNNCFSITPHSLCQNVRILDCGQLSRSLQHLRLQRNSLQS